MIIFTNKLFGTENHLMYNSGYEWIDSIPSDAFVYDGAHKYSLSDWFSITGSNIPALVEEKYKKMAEELNIENPSWHKLLGNSFKKQIKKITNSTDKMIQECDYRDYEPVWRECQDFMWSMKPAKINRARYASLKALNVNLPGFNPVTGSIDAVRYDRKTKTGRLRVTEGPSVLTIKSTHRNIVKDCRQIDFKNMEPRLLLAFLGKEIHGDLYANIQKDLNLKGDRSYVKVSIISSLYGSRVVPEISEYFAIPHWIEELEKDKKNGWIRNYFGRPISVENVNGHHLLALWLQSSAADAALLAFSKFFKEREDLVPHWIIHDACIFSGEGDIPEYLYINEDIKLPIECTVIK
jgi:hypothetical protein